MFHNLKIFNLGSTDVFTREIHKKDFFVLCPMSAMLNTYAIDVVSGVYLNLLGTVSNINGD